MVNTNQTLEQLMQLKLHGMAQSYGTTLALPSHELPSAHELIALMVDAEQNSSTRKTISSNEILTRLPCNPICLWAFLIMITYGVRNLINKH